MPFGMANAPALFQELMNQVLTIPKQRPAVQALLERGAVAEAHIDDVLLGTDSIEDHLLLLSECFDVCVEQNLRIKVAKCEFFKTELEYLGSRVRDGHWGPCADKLKPQIDFTINKAKGKAEGVKRIRQFIGGCNFYRRHVRNFTESSAILTDLIKDNTPWKWTDEEKNKLEQLKGIICKAIPLGVPPPKGGIVFVSDNSNVGGGGTLFHWQALQPEQCQEINERLRTQGVDRDSSLKHSYNEEEWRLVRLGHWNSWNAARSKYHTYAHELLGGVLVLASQRRIIGNNLITWLCDQDSVKYFMDSPPPEQRRLQRWRVFLSQLRLAVHHIQGRAKRLPEPQLVQPTLGTIISGNCKGRVRQDGCATPPVHEDHATAEEVGKGGTAEGLRCDYEATAPRAGQADRWRTVVNDLRRAVQGRPSLCT